MSFVEKNVSVIQAALSHGHPWTHIYRNAVADGCPSKSVRYFTRAAKKALGLDAEAAALPEDTLGHPKSRAAGRSRRDAGGRRPLAEVGAAAAKASNAARRPAPSDGDTQSVTEAKQLAEMPAPDSGAVAMPRPDNPAVAKPAALSGALTGQRLSDAPDGAAHRPYAETRMSPPPLPIDPGCASWDSATPSQRAMLLKDAE